MRLFGRNDTVLVAGLTIALFVIFSPVVSGLLEYARELDRDNGLQLMPALVILAAAFIFVQLWKRKEMRAEAVAGAASTRLAHERAAEMERLVQFGHAL